MCMCYCVTLCSISALIYVRFQQILLYYMEHNEYELVMETCKRHG